MMNMIVFAMNMMVYHDECDTYVFYQVMVRMMPFWNMMPMLTRDMIVSSDYLVSALSC